MINYEMIMANLEEYNEDELFYREYYYAKASANPADMDRFLEKHSIAEVQARKLICPELDSADISFMPETGKYTYFTAETNICVIKHNRYSPVYQHAHEYFELFYVLSGHCIHEIDGSKEELKKGSLCFISPEQIHSISVFDNSLVINILIQKSTFNDIFFNMLRSNNILTQFFMGSLYSKSTVTHLLFDTQDDKELEEMLLSMIMEEMQQDEYTNKILNSLAGVFFTKLMRKYGNSARIYRIGNEFNPIASQMLAYINDNYTTITLNKLAHDFGYTEEHCSRLIKTTSGQTFTTILRKVRLNRAESMLLTTPFSIEQISEIIGYENPCTFNALFKKEYGMTPGKYRQKGSW